MAFLKAIAPKIHLGTTPYVIRYPEYNPDVYYQTGSVVYRHFQLSDSDSDTPYYNFYVSQRDVTPNKGNPEDLRDEWLLWVSGDPAIPSLYSDSDLRDFVLGVQQDYNKTKQDIDSDFLELDSDIQYILTWDSELRDLRQRVTAIENKKIIKNLDELELGNNKTPIWNDSDNKYDLVVPVLTFNGSFPNSAGEITYETGAVKTGTRDDRLDSEIEGTLFIVVGDSETEFDGITYAFSSAGWQRVIGFTEVENDNRYVNITGDVMTGPLLMARDPLRDSEVATKRYVDTFFDTTKQDTIIYLDSETDLALQTHTPDALYYIRSTSNLWTYTNGALSKFSFPAERLWDPVIISATAIPYAASVSYFDVRVDTYRFSDSIEGYLEIWKTGQGNTAIVTRVNISGTLDANYGMDAKLLDASLQQFTVRVTAKYASYDEWNVRFTAHDGSTSSVTIGAGTANRAVSNTNRLFNFGEY